MCANIGAGEDENLGQMNLYASYIIIAVIIYWLGNSRKMSRGTESQAQLAREDGLRGAACLHLL